jgi:hypothetical protein
MHKIGLWPVLARQWFWVVPECACLPPSAQDDDRPPRGERYTEEHVVNTLRREGMGLLIRGHQVSKHLRQYVAA